MLSGQDLDRELKAALSVAPSADFEARVLRRVEADRTPHWRTQYVFLAAAAALVIAAGLFFSRRRPEVPVTPAPAPQIVQGTAPQPSAPAQAAVVHDTPHKSSERRPRVVVASLARAALRVPPRAAEPEVLVPLNQMEAVRRLVRAVNEGRIEAPAEPPEGPMAPPSELGVAPVAIAPVVVEPIPVPPVGSGGNLR